MSFKTTEIPQRFSNVKHGGKHLIYDRYIVSGDTGHIAEILTYAGEISVLIDNFPGQKLHYKYDFPINDAECFRRDMLRLGLVLKWNHTLCSLCDQIKDCEGGNICSECEKHS